MTISRQERNSPEDSLGVATHQIKYKKRKVQGYVYHKKELENKVQELRSLKAMKEELENELKAVEHEIISYMTENDLDTEITDTAKITYKPQSRTAIDKDKLKDVLGEDLKPFEKVSFFKVLRIK